MVQSLPVRHLPQLDLPAPVIPSSPLPSLSMPPPQSPAIPVNAEPMRVLPPQPRPLPRQSGTRYIKLLFSLVLFVAVALIPIKMTNQDGQVVELTLQQHLTIGYVVWALFWGTPAAWRLWRRFVWSRNMHRAGCSPAGLAWVMSSLCLLVFGGWFYCLFGGGIYQFFKHWWSASRTA